MLWGIGIVIALGCAFALVLWRFTSDQPHTPPSSDDDALWPDKEPDPPAT